MGINLYSFISKLSVSKVEITLILGGFESLLLFSFLSGFIWEEFEIEISILFLYIFISSEFES